MPEHYVEKVAALWEARGSASGQRGRRRRRDPRLLLGVPRVTKRIPAPLIAIALVAAATAALGHHVAPSWSVATIGSRFHTIVHGVDVAGIPPVVPTPALPWEGALSFHLVRELFPAAFAIAMLGAIESLLSAVIADGMTGTKHDPNAELVALGIGNLIAPIFGGIAATGALARTATNIRAGARSPIACRDALARRAAGDPGPRAARRLRADGLARRAAAARRVEHVRGAATSSGCCGSRRAATSSSC